jgi:hypothetical protein
MFDGPTVPDSHEFPWEKVAETHDQHSTAIAGDMQTPASPVNPERPATISALIAIHLTIAHREAISMVNLEPIGRQKKDRKVPFSFQRPYACLEISQRHMSNVNIRTERLGKAVIRAKKERIGTNGRFLCSPIGTGTASRCVWDWPDKHVGWHKRQK